MIEKAFRRILPKCYIEIREREMVHEEYLEKVKLNDNSEIVKMVQEGLASKGGYCPCSMEDSEETKCICKEFRDQIDDPEYTGYCHCMLYYKAK